jgi:hypothetical protein
MNYQLAVELGPRFEERADERLVAAWEALWANEKLDGPDGGSVPRILSGESLRGVLTLPDGELVECTCRAVRDETNTVMALVDGKLVEDTDWPVPDEVLMDWLVLYVSYDELERVYEVVSYETGFDAWQAPLDEWLADIGRSIYEWTPFALALIGPEVSGEIYARDIMTRGTDIWYSAMLYPDASGDLEWYPARS